MPPELDYATMSRDIILKGNLRKAKNWNKRFFVLRDGSPANLEYYENERKWKSNGKPKRRISLERPWNIGKNKDSKHEFLVVVFTEDEYLSMSAENADMQERWVDALQKAAKPEPGSLLFKHMWHVTLENKELEGYRSSLLMSLHGPHHICVTHDHQMIFVHANNSGGVDRNKGEPIEIYINSIRVCGHKEGMFFIEPGRSSGIGNGRLWMDLSDEVMASSMHMTIRQIMSPEDSSCYRGRSYSSGSNSSRMRSIRSHHNNPPPSQVGMGKVASCSSSISTKQRIRCDSLPVTHIGDPNDSRLRCGSEGEGTMRRPVRVNSLRYANGAASPAMRNRLWPSHNRRVLLCHHHNHAPSHSHTTSLPGSCTGSSTASSTEQLNVAFPGSDSSTTNIISHLPPTSPPVVGNNTANEDYIGCLSQTSQSTAQPNGPSGCGHKRHQSSGQSTTPDNQQHQTFNNSYYVGTEIGRHYCSSCLAHIPYLQRVGDGRIRLNMAPPPPDMEPPHNPLNNTSSSSVANSHEYANIFVHSRTHSVDENISCGTAASSLSGSPFQPANYPPPVATLRDGSSPPGMPDAQSLEALSPRPAVSADSSSSSDDYTEMGVISNASYPLSTISPSIQKPPTYSRNSFIAKLVSYAGGLTSRTESLAADSDYTPMNPSQPSLTENKVQSKSPSTTTAYVPMKSFALNSLPKDIRSRRRSMPDTSFRSYSNSNNRSSPPYGYSPDKSYEVMGSAHFCQDCNESLNAPVMSIAEKSAEFKAKTALRKHSCANYSVSDKSVLDFDKCSLTAVTDTPIAPIVGDSKRVLVSNQTATPVPNEYLTMQSQLHHEVGDVARKPVENTKSNLSGLSSSPGDPGMLLNDLNGYLPMSPVNLGLTGQRCPRGIINTILSVAENNNVPAPPPHYPHQQKGKKPSLSTNSLERPKSSHRNKRPISLGFHYNSSSLTKRTQSLRPGKKVANDSSPDPHATTSNITTASPRPPLSPGGEYVNIDVSKARQQMQSPHVVCETNPEFEASRSSEPTPEEIVKPSLSRNSLKK